MCRRTVVYVLLSVALAASSCSAQRMARKVRDIRSRDVRASLDLPSDDRMPVMDSILSSPESDTIHVTLDGEQRVLMRALAVGDDGLVATNMLDAAYVTARFRNVAERHGKVDIRFDVRVPKDLRDSKWQLRMRPRMAMMGEDVALEPIFITGSGYRKAQLRGYQLYQRFLSSIITDTTKLIYMHQLEMFLKRNLPKVYALKHDYNYVSDDVIESYYGVTESEAVDHYSRLFLVWRNNRRRDKTPKMYEKYVKAPLVSDGIRLDTVYRSGGEFVYEYVQPVTVRRGLRKVDVTISGDIYEQDRKIYDIPKSEPLTFYISSFSTLLENKVVYKDAVVERRVDADMTYFVDFEKGRAEVKEGYMDNASEIARIKSTLSGLLASDVFALDSVSVSAYASPEGGEALNRSLSGRRSASVGEYFGRYMKHVRDSVLAEGFAMDSDGNVVRRTFPEIRFDSRVGGEDWDKFAAIIRGEDGLQISASQAALFEEAMKVPGLDDREAVIRRDREFYAYCVSDVYPRLRSVKFDFHLHRRGMVKDTVHTTVVDTVYQRGLEALRSRDYPLAVSLLRPYGDYNAALAFVADGKDRSALSVLGKLAKTPKVKYLLAVLYSRSGMTAEAVRMYVEACREDRAFVSRGNLDPEISALIKAYGLNRDPDEDYGDVPAAASATGSGKED